MDYKGTVTMTAAEFVEIVETIRDLQSKADTYHKWWTEKVAECREMKEALATAEKKLAEEDDF